MSKTEVTSATKEAFYEQRACLFIIRNKKSFVIPDFNDATSRGCERNVAANQAQQRR